jgi:hypothetical protein
MGNNGTESLLARLLSLNSSVTAEIIPCHTETHNINIRARLQETQHIFKHIDDITFDGIPCFHHGMHALHASLHACMMHAMSIKEGTVESERRIHHGITGICFFKLHV